jgi:hypothetical protein
MDVLRQCFIVAAPFLLVWEAGSLRAVDPQDFTVQVTAAVQSAPPQILLEWPGSSFATGYTVSRKLLQDQSWGVLGTLPGLATGFADNSVVPGAGYEYEIAQSNSDGLNAYGYIYAGMEVPFEADRGRVVLVVDNTVSSDLDAELTRLEQDLVGDGWSVSRHDVSRSASPPDVKSVIAGDYQADPTEVKAVFLVGHVPVPYSGDLNPDMHANHLGAWPADVYYGDMNGTWTDSVINDTSAEDPRNFNVPGDGKFDQSDIPAPVVLEVGRVDLQDLPSFAPRTELDLLRQYLDKNHNYRHGLMGAQRRGLIRDNFGVIDGDAPATDAWRAFPPFFGAGQFDVIGPGDFFPTLASSSYLFAYGGGGGEYYQADGVGSTTDFANQSPQAVFFMLHGSYFGDWDSTDNFLRAALASSGNGLVAAWTGLPHWYLHPMALGETIGLSTLITQNNRDLYKNQMNLSANQVHIALMGDPTLRMHVVIPPANLNAQPDGASTVNLSWDASPDSVVGYYVYRADNSLGPFSRLTRSFLDGTTYADTDAPPGPKVYMVRAIKLESSGSGTYYNPSQGIFATADAGSGQALPIVAVQAVNPTADEAASTEGDFMITRAGPSDSALTVSFSLGGSAVNGTDYQMLGDSVVIPANSSDVWIPVKPMPDTLADGDETVVLTLTPDAGYELGSPSTATVDIKESPADHPPMANNVAVSTLEDTSLMISAGTLLANDSDPDPGDQIHLASIITPSQNGGSVVLTNGSVSYQPPQGFVGTDSFGYSIQDNSGESASADVLVTVAAPGKIDSIVRQANDSVLIQFDGTAGRPYAVQMSTDLVNWTTVSTGVFPSTGFSSYADSHSGSNGDRFYRVQWQ